MKRPRFLRKGLKQKSREKSISEKSLKRLIQRKASCKVLTEKEMPPEIANLARDVIAIGRKKLLSGIAGPYLLAATTYEAIASDPRYAAYAAIGAALLANAFRKSKAQGMKLKELAKAICDSQDPRIVSLRSNYPFFFVMKRPARPVQIVFTDREALLKVFGIRFGRRRQSIAQ